MTGISTRLPDWGVLEDDLAVHLRTEDNCLNNSPEYSKYSQKKWNHRLERVEETYPLIN